MVVVVVVVSNLTIFTCKYNNGEEITSLHFLLQPVQCDNNSVQGKLVRENDNVIS